MIRALYYTPDSPLEIEFPTAKFIPALQNPKGLLWVDFTGEPPGVCEPLLKEFGFHPLAIDDALQETHTPKVDDWGEYVYIVLNAMVFNDDPANGSLKTNELDAFLGRNYIVTHHDQVIQALDEVWDACQRDARHTQSGADHLMYKIADHIVAGYMPIVGEIDKEIDEIEDQIFDRPTPETLGRIFTLKRALLSMRRVITPQREVLNKLARDDYLVIDPKDRVFFRDVYDHLVRLHDLNESMRDLVSGAQRGDQFGIVQLGTSGDDLINESGLGKSIYVNAGMGNDTIIGGNKADFLVGGAGNDVLNGGRGSDQLLG
ncbi:MAG: CorA family divalent cation transporter, partial [Anaerolineales bacterium]|nr:CorA family divalent cation transporter [Anaerolineales bacterium]